MKTADSASFKGGYNSSPRLCNLEDQYWERSRASEVVMEDASMKNDNCLDSNADGSFKFLSKSTSKLKLGDKFIEDSTLQATDGTVINELLKNSGSVYGRSNVLSSASSCSLSSSTGKDIDPELKFELEAIEAQYQRWIDELSRMKLEALEAARRRWMAKKKVVSQ